MRGTWGLCAEAAEQALRGWKIYNISRRQGSHSASESLSAAAECRVPSARSRDSKQSIARRSGSVPGAALTPVSFLCSASASPVRRRPDRGNGDADLLPSLELLEAESHVDTACLLEVGVAMGVARVEVLEELIVVFLQPRGGERWSASWEGERGANVLHAESSEHPKPWSVLVSKPVFPRAHD